MWLRHMLSFVQQLIRSEMSLQAVVRKGQLWRLVTSQLSHVSFLHLVLNVAGLWNVSNFAEGAADSGTLFYIGRTLLLLTLSALVSWRGL